MALDLVARLAAGLLDATPALAMRAALEREAISTPGACGFHDVGAENGGAPVGLPISIARVGPGGWMLPGR